MMESVKEFAQELERLATISQAEASEPIVDLKQKLEDQVYLFRRQFTAGRFAGARHCMTRAAMYCMMMAERAEQLKVQQGR